MGRGLFGPERPRPLARSPTTDRLRPRSDSGALRHPASLDPLLLARSRPPRRAGRPHQMGLQASGARHGPHAPLAAAPLGVGHRGGGAASPPGAAPLGGGAPPPEPPPAPPGVPHG